MTDIWTLSPAELRGYARGLCNTAALLGATWARTGHDSGHFATIVALTREAWEREAAIVEGFADRLEITEGTQEAEEEQEDNPIVYWLAQDPEAGHFETAKDAAHSVPVLAPVEIASNAWPATRWAIQEFISDAGETQISWADTREEMMTYAADLISPAEEEQDGLADAVADSLAQPQPANQAQRHSTKAKPDEMKARAREMFLAGVPMPQIGAQLGGIPKTTINTWAGKYGWRNERDATTGRPAGMSGPKPEPVAAAPDAMTTEDMAEARERLRTGQSRGARDIVDYFGCTPEEAQALVDEHRARMGRAA